MAATNAGIVNINSDLGESFGPWVMGNDAEVLKIVTLGQRRLRLPCQRPGGDDRHGEALRSRTASRSAPIPASPTCRASAAG